MRGRGEGSVVKRNIKRKDGTTYVRYQAMVTAGRRADGRPRRLYGPTRATRPEARADLSQLLASTELGVTPDKERLGDYLDAWLKRREPHLKVRAYDTYKADIENHIKPRIGHVRLSELTPAVVVDFLAELEKLGRPGVVRKCRSVLHNALNHAFREERITRNPVTVTEAPPTPSSARVRWGPKDANAFAKAASKHKDGAVFLLTLACGLRIGEALGLMWADLDGDVLSIERALVTVGRQRFDTPKTARSVRRLKLGADVLRMLEDHRLQMEIEGRLVEREYQMVRRPGAPETTFTGVVMFPDEHGMPWRLDVLRNRYEEMLAASKAPEVRIHDLRHYNLSRLIDLGWDAATVSRRAGHSRTSTTMDVYVEAFEERLERASVDLSDVIGPDEEERG